MVFVPFTAVDNHNHNVIVGAALSTKENVINYTWMLQAFMQAHSKAPTLVLTDQCPAMKQAVETVFPNSRHRLCLWHISSKLHKYVRFIYSHFLNVLYLTITIFYCFCILLTVYT